MSENNKENLLYFENDSMKGLYDDMQQWQKESQKRLLSTMIQKDGEKYCCIALSNPTEVRIVGEGGKIAQVDYHGRLNVVSI